MTRIVAATVAAGSVFETNFSSTAAESTSIAVGLRGRREFDSRFVLTTAESALLRGSTTSALVKGSAVAAFKAAGCS